MTSLLGLRSFFDPFLDGCLLSYTKISDREPDTSPNDQNTTNSSYSSGFY